MEDFLDEHQRRTKARMDHVRELMVNRSGRRAKTTTYGQKGGESPVKGKVGSVYVAEGPDGVKQKVRSFKVHNDIAGAVVMAFYFWKGRWYTNGVHLMCQLPDWVRRQYVGNHENSKLIPATCMKLGGNK